MPKNSSAQDTSTSVSCMPARIASHGRRAIQSSIEANGRTVAIPNCVSHRGVRVGNLEIQHGPPPAFREGRRAAGDHLSALRHLRQRVRRQDPVDPGREVVLGGVRLHETDVAPAVNLDPAPRLIEHRVGQIDADDPALGADRLLEEREVQTRTAGHVDDGVARDEAELLYGPPALCLLGVAGRGIEPGSDVVALRLLAVHLDQVLAGLIDLAHDPGPASTAALISVISRSLTR